MSACKPRCAPIRRTGTDQKSHRTRTFGPQPRSFSLPSVRFCLRMPTPSDADREAHIVLPLEAAAGNPPGVRHSRPPLRPGRPIRSVNRGISDPSALAARSVDRGQDYLGRKRGTGPRPALRFGSPLRCTPLALPPGMRFSVIVIVIDVAAPGRTAHHPTITPRGVICGDRDDSAITRNLRAWSIGRQPGNLRVCPHGPSL